MLADVDPDDVHDRPRATRAGGRLRARGRSCPSTSTGSARTWTPIVELARRHGLKVVEDAAQAHGAEYAGRRAGALGDAAAFSFYPTKNLGALGDGGAVVTTDSAVAERARRLRNYGERERYVSVEPGVNSRLDALQAAILSAKLPHLDAWNDRRRAIAARYLEELDGHPLALPVEAGEADHVFHLFVVRAPRRERIPSRPRRRAWAPSSTTRGRCTGIRVSPPAAANEPAVAERFCDEVVSLPLYPELTDEETRSVAEAVESALAVA